MGIKGAIFDVDGTLLDSMIFWDSLWTRLWKDYGKENETPAREFVDRLRTLPLQDGLAYFRAYYSLKVSQEELWDLSMRLLREFYEGTVSPKEGIPAFLEVLHGAGVPICIATASERQGVEAALSRLGLSHYFSRIFLCAEVGKGKSEPDIFLAALAHLGTPKEETFVFEDSATALATAKAAGFPTVGIYDAAEPSQEALQKNASYYISQGESILSLLDKKDFLKRENA